MTKTSLQRAFDETFVSVKGYLDRSLAEFEKRIEKLEARRELSYAGTYEAGREYYPGEFVTHDGSVWACRRQTTTRPDGGDAWTLAVKRGRDGRDAR